MAQRYGSQLAAADKSVGLGFAPTAGRANHNFDTRGVLCGVFLAEH